MTVIRTTRLATVLLATSAALSIHSAAHADDDMQMHKVSQAIGASAHAGKRLSMGEVIAKLERAGYSHFTEVELDDGHFEVEARNKQGQRVELDVHARTGKILRTQLED